MTPRSELLLSGRCAGVCYPREAAACLDYFRAFFDQEGGAPWRAEAEAGEPPLRGVLAPHIDFRVSTVAYSHAFDAWLRRPTADVYLILGVGHRARLPWSIDGRDYATPLGKIAVETEMAAELLRRSPFPLGDAQAHVGEHSIEFPLVLIQALRKLRGIERPFTFLPVLCGGMFPEVEAGRPPAPGSHAVQFAGALRELVAAYGDRLQIVTSIDGCHIGPRFEHPYKVNQARLRECAAWEETLWQQVEAGNAEGFFAHLGRDANARYFDGVGALWLLMQILGDAFRLRRTHHEQWFEAGDASAVTFTSGFF